MKLFHNLSKTLIPLIIGFIALFDSCIAAGPPKWVKADTSGKGIAEYGTKLYSTTENPGAKYNPNLPEELRAQYKGQKWSPQIVTDVCSKPPDSGYFCNGAIGDLPPIHQRFYFEVKSKSCRCMLYNGCDGNQNNFRSYEHCVEWCASPNITLFDRRTVGKSNYVFAKNSAKCLYFY